MRLRECGEMEERHLQQMIERISWGDEKLSEEFLPISQYKLPYPSKNMWNGQSKNKRNRKESEIRSASASASEENGNRNGSGTESGVPNKGDETQEGTGENHNEDIRVENSPVQNERKRRRKIAENTDEGSHRSGSVNGSGTESGVQNEAEKRQWKKRKVEKEPLQTKRRNGRQSESKMKVPRKQREKTKKKKEIKDDFEAPPYMPHVIGEISMPTMDEYAAAVKAFEEGKFDRNSFSKKDLEELVSFGEWISDAVSYFFFYFFF